MTKDVGAEPLEAKVARHQFVIKVVRTNPPFGTTTKNLGIARSVRPTRIQESDPEGLDESSSD
jgi:hypothetical protein